MTPVNTLNHVNTLASARSVRTARSARTVPSVKTMRFVNPSSRRRAGFTLYELMVAMTIGTTVLMAATSLIQHAFRWTKISRQRHEDDQTAFQLSRLLRDDVHRATDLQSGDDQLTIQLQDDSQIRYQIEQGNLTRTVTATETTTHREHFQWSHHRECSFKRDPTTEQVALVIRTVSVFSKDTALPWRSIRLSPGLRHRHETGGIDP